MLQTCDIFCFRNGDLLKKLTSTNPVLPKLNLRSLRNVIQENLVNESEPMISSAPGPELQPPILPDGNIINIEPINDEININQENGTYLGTELRDITYPQLPILSTCELDMRAKKVDCSPEQITEEPKKKIRKIVFKCSRPLKTEAGSQMIVHSAEEPVSGTPIVQKDMQRLLSLLSKPVQSGTLPSSAKTVVLNNKPCKVIVIAKTADNALRNVPEGTTVSVKNELETISAEVTAVPDVDMQQPVKAESKDSNSLGNQNIQTSPQFQQDSYRSIMTKETISPSNKRKIRKRSSTQRTKKKSHHGSLCVSSDFETKAGLEVNNCHSCNMKCKDEQELQRHLAWKHNLHRFICWVCAFTAETTETIEAHCLEKHPGDIFLCPKTGCNYRALRKVSHMEFREGFLKTF